jgi:hypothetical protein
MAFQIFYYMLINVTSQEARGAVVHPLQAYAVSHLPGFA